MKLHIPRAPVRRALLGATVGTLLLLSACSTLAPGSDPDPAGGSEDAAAAVAASEPLADPAAAPARRARLSPGPRPPLRRAGTSRGRHGIPSDPFGYADREPASAPGALQTLIDSAPDDAGTERAPVAGPKPRAEPLAEQANRPYRLRGRKYRPMTELLPFRQRGVASWYGKPFHGRLTAIGERYNMHAMTAAHPTLPLPSYVKVTNLRNGTSVIVRVNDRGPFAHERVIDLSQAAAGHLGALQGGVAAVEINLIVPEPAGTVSPAPLAGMLD